MQALASGLIRNVGLVPEKSTGLILTDDGFGELTAHPVCLALSKSFLRTNIWRPGPRSIEWLLIDLALASIGAASLAPTRLNLLSPILEQNHVADVIFADVTLLESILEQVAELGNHFPIVIVGKNALQKAEASRNTGFNVIALEELEAVGKEVDEPTTVERRKRFMFCKLTRLEEYSNASLVMQDLSGYLPLHSLTKSMECVLTPFFSELSSDHN